MDITRIDDLLGKIVLIYWRDASHMPNDWAIESELKFPETKITSVGKLVKTDEYHLMIAQTFCVDQSVANTFVITKVQIINIKELK